MGEEADASYCERPPSAFAGCGGEDEDRVFAWEIGLPSSDDLTPLSQSLISPELASAFSISPEPSRTMIEVHCASQNTVSGLRRHTNTPSSLKPFPTFPSTAADDPMVLLTVEEADSSSALRPENSNDDNSARALKRPRLVWTPQLHKRFIDVVAHVGVKSAVPKTIMQLMNVEGLTRENVASHLQKYRLYLKRMHGFSNEEPSPSDHLFSSTPVPQSLQESHEPMPMPMPMQYPMQPMMPMPVFGMGMMPVNNHQGGGTYRGFESHHLYGEVGEGQRDWSGGNKFGSILSYPRVTPNDK